jgi:predicted NBD/HSP70 family sugar kinase
MSANMGDILYGYRGFAGEIGHLPYPNTDNDLICSCGNKNCLETVLNTSRILDFMNDKFGTKAAAIEDVTEQEFIRQTTYDFLLPPLVFMATTVSNIFDPRRIIIGGSVLEPFYQYLIVAFEKELKQKAWFNGPAEICWYNVLDMDGSYGALLHSSEKIVEDFINHINLDH